MREGKRVVCGKKNKKTKKMTIHSSINAREGLNTNWLG